MGWNGKTFKNAYYNIDWKDYVRDERIDKFEIKLQEEVAEFIANKIRQEFAAEIQTNEVRFHTSGGDKDFFE